MTKEELLRYKDRVRWTDKGETDLHLQADIAYQLTRIANVAENWQNFRPTLVKGPWSASSDSQSDSPADELADAVENELKKYSDWVEANPEIEVPVPLAIMLVDMRTSLKSALAAYRKREDA